MMRTYIIIFLLIVVTAAVYSQVRSHDFVYYDDQEYVIENKQVQDGLTLKGVQWAFTTFHASNWHPLTWLSHMADRQFFGPSPAGSHVVNALLHILNTVLLMHLLQRMTGGFWQSAFVAALFALHPLHVESVAWVAERKDVLSTLFFMLTILLYARYVERPGALRYGGALACFALGLMAKPMLVTLPFVLLLLDFWPLERFDRSSFMRDAKPSLTGQPLSRLILEKVPFFLLAVASSLVTLSAQHRVIASVDELPWAVRIGNAVTSYAGYLMKMIWPAGLSVFYPLTLELDPWRVSGAALLLLSVSVWVVRSAGKRPYLAVGWLWYLGTLVPVIGIIQVGSQSMADRYTYIPLIGIFIMAAWGLSEALSRWPRIRATAAASAGILLIVLTGLTWGQVGKWKDGLTLFSSCSAMAKENHIVEHGIGMIMAKRGNDAEAIGHIRNAIRLNPNYARANYDLGILLARNNDPQGAAKRFQEAVRIEPDNVDFRFEWGVALVDAGRLDEGIEQYAAVLKERPDYVDAYINIGVALARQGNMHGAVARFSRALELSPNNEKAQRNLQLAKSRLSAANLSSMH